jgi:hypothetical protein
MFTKGFKKQADAPPIMPTAAQGKAFRKGMNQDVSVSQGWQNIKNEVGSLFGGAPNVGKMGG